ncbi:MAG: presqualene diphosphate synthase HpnD [Candidatus Tectomicrobia bacterium]|uniref:Presqualene diphosphate synthase HpnD n=1 Tax=Tectimicrobiota bacterium TaxID=2528274 RepID=A0A932GNS6_UNCTE|nr:presqualene diphosphate synthase HpnD [Candidatus Tectomicrobia bacterium]
MDQSLLEAQLYCQELTKRTSKSFYYSFLFLPAEKRRAIYALYAFCRYSDEISDDQGAPEERLGRLQEWQRELEHAYEGRPSHPITRALSPQVERFHLPKSYFDELLAGVAMDFTRTRYSTFSDLYQYCYRVASIVGLLCIEVFGYRDPKVRQYAENLGIGFQLTNILRDLKEDSLRGRIYLPLEDLERFSYSEEDLLAHRYTPSFRQLMAFEYDRAKDYYQRARSFLPREERKTLAVSETMRALYSRILEEIARRNFNVFDGRVDFPVLRKLFLATRIWLRLQLTP